MAYNEKCTSFNLFDGQEIGCMMEAGARSINSFLIRLTSLIVALLAPVAKTPTHAKVADYPGLYRHARSGRYYGVKKLKRQAAGAQPQDGRPQDR